MMRRGVVISLSVLGVLAVVLAVALASVGTELDRTRIDRDQLDDELEGLRQEVDTLSEERGRLQRQAADHTKAIEQLKLELDRARASQAGAAQAAEPAATPAAPAATTPAATTP